MAQMTIEEAVHYLAGEVDRLRTEAEATASILALVAHEVTQMDPALTKRLATAVTALPPNVRQSTSSDLILSVLRREPPTPGTNRPAARLRLVPDPTDEPQP